MITGPPGIGKTTSAHLCAKLAGFTPIEVNASDSRSKKLVEVGILFLLLLGYDCVLIAIDLCRVELIWIIRLWMGGWVMGK
jgi:DNA polymerase III delta prime subunit